ncbi:hypothetical protein MY3957_005292 [Beauveria namnaoensis]
MTSKGINTSVQLAVLGAGGMGAGLCLLLAEHGHTVYFFDPNEENVQKLSNDAFQIGLQDKVTNCKSVESLFRNVNDEAHAAVYLMSVPHGAAADKAVDSLRPYLPSDDVIIDCGNEHYENTERRQKDLAVYGVKYIGCGVSGGYQSARSGPSMSPGGDLDVVRSLLPFFQKIAAKDGQGNPCTAVIGTGGSGHYVKMIHNGIEHGMMGILGEIWLIMSRGLRMSHDKIADTLESWNNTGELRGCLLLGIGADLLRATNDKGEHVLSTIRDKVVQDAEGSEGTGTWTCAEAISHHSPAATIVAAHFYRCASAFATSREKVTASLAFGDLPQPPQEMTIDSVDEFLAALHATTCFGFLSCFAQGLNVLRAKDKQAGWRLKYTDVVQVWRAGCIIRADGILSTFDSVFNNINCNIDDLFWNSEVTAAMHQRMSFVKRVVVTATDADMLLPTISQSFEHFKYIQATHGPAQFIEAQMDYFGKHMFDTWTEPPGGAKTGKHHFEWKQAKGSSDY